ncbi:MAG: tetratricopeptide repeat protein [bacterium]|nr:tetratricopeptide repeat protein [bacterium]
MTVKIILCTTLLVLISLGSATAQSTDELFRQGNELFEAKQYDSAVAVYGDVVGKGLESAPLYFNLGNAYFRNGDLGRAILYYHKARRLDPDDEDIVGNLEFARRFTSVQMEGVKLNPISSLFGAIVEPYDLNFLAWVTSGFFILLFVLLTMRFGLNVRGLVVRSGLTVALIVVVTLSLLTTVKYDNDYRTPMAVVIAQEAVVRTGPSLLSDKELDAVPGLVVEILDETGEFYNVLFENKRRGWIEKDLVAVI